MPNEKFVLYKKIFIESYEQYKDKDDALISYIVEILKDHKIEVEDYAAWLKINPDILETIRLNSADFKMIKFWDKFISNSISIEDLF